MPETTPTTRAERPGLPSSPGGYFAASYFPTPYFGAFSTPGAPEKEEEFEPSIPGVEVMVGGINIVATKPGGNSALVEYWGDRDIKVTLNGRSVLFRQAQVGQLWSVVYSGDQRGQQGGDRFENRTDLSSSVSMYGGHNTVIGGSGWDFVMVTQGDNYVETGEGGGMVYSFAGPTDQIKAGSDVSVHSYDYDPYYYARYY